MLIINEIDFTQRRIIELIKDEKFIELSLTKTKLKIVFNLKKTIIIQKNKNIEKIVDVFVDDEDEIIEEIKDEIIKEVIEEVIQEVIEEEVKKKKKQKKKQKKK